MVKILGRIDPKLPSTGMGAAQASVGAQDLARYAISPLLTAGETIAGLPGDILQGITNIAGIEAEPGKGTAQVPITSQQLRKQVREPLSKYFGVERLTVPQGELENKFNDFVSDATSLLVGGAKPQQALKVAGLGNLAGFMAHELGAGEGLETGVKLGTMLFSGLHGGRKQLTKEMENRYKTFEETTKGKTVSTDGFEKNLNKLYQQLEKGAITPAKTTAKEQIAALEGKILKGRIPVDELWEFKKDLNAELIKLRKGDPLKKYYEQLVGITKEGMRPLGKELLENLDVADELYGALQSSNKVGRFMNDNINFASIKNPYVKMALGGAGAAGVAFKGLPGLGSASALAGTGLAANEAFKFLNFLYKSPTAQKTYQHLMKSALKENVSAVVKAAARLDTLATKHEADLPPQQRVRVIGKI